jgi:Predicted SAM-dependent methyltransferase
MKISKRLQTIADNIPEGSNVIDVGCDHALLDIYLSLYKNCICTATDINVGALDQAKYNIARFGVKNISLILTDGLNGVNVNFDDVLVISGMGTSTIHHILFEKELPKTIIISTHNEWEELRKDVVSKGYRIKDEKFVEDNKKGYLIIIFEIGNDTYTEIDYIYGPILKRNKDYLESLYNKAVETLERIPDDSIEKMEKEKRLNEIQSLLKDL